MFVHILIDVREHITVGERRKRDMKKSKNVRSCSSASVVPMFSLNFQMKRSFLILINQTNI